MPRVSQPSWPGPVPAVPNARRYTPFLSNTWIRLLPPSRTYTSWFGPIAMPR